MDGLKQQVHARIFFNITILFFLSNWLRACTFDPKQIDKRQLDYRIIPSKHPGHLGLKKKVFDWRNPTDPIYPVDPTYFY